MNVSSQSEQDFIYTDSHLYIADGDSSLVDMITCKKVLINVPNLLELAKHKCHRPDCSKPIVRCVPTISGCSIKLELMCSEKHLIEWYSCPNVTSKGGGSIPANNILQAAGILFSGSHYSKYFMMNRICNAHGISESIFYRYQKHLLAPTVDEYWLAQQQSALMQLSGKALVLAGDGCCDSPGKSAKFCTYTLMDTATEMVVQTSTVDKREVGGKSPNMEREALFRSLTAVTQHVTVTEVVTDASTSVKKMLGMQYNYMHKYSYSLLYCRGQIS